MVAPKFQIDGVYELTEAEGWAVLEQRTQRRLGIGAAEFIRRWQAGEYGESDTNLEALELAMLLPVVGIDPWIDGPDA